MNRWISRAVSFGIGALCSAPVCASVWTFNQVARTDSFAISAEIDLSGTDTLADLPRRSSADCLFACSLPDLMPIVSFSFAGPGEQFTLANFQFPTLATLPYPIWEISPIAILLDTGGNFGRMFDIDFADDRIVTAAWASQCAIPCEFTGVWTDPPDHLTYVPPVDEPSDSFVTLALALGLAGGTMAWARRK